MAFGVLKLRARLAKHLRDILYLSANIRKQGDSIGDDNTLFIDRAKCQY